MTRCIPGEGILVGIIVVVTVEVGFTAVKKKKHRLSNEYFAISFSLA